MEKFKNNKIIRLTLLFLAIGLVFVGCGKLWPMANSNQNVNTNINQNQNDFADLLSERIPEHLLKKDPQIILTPKYDFIITTSIISNYKDKIVYSEMSNSAFTASDYFNDWEYNLYVKNLNNGEIKKIYSFPKIRASFLNGPCPLVFFPIAWSKSDKKIILEWGNPTICGSGGIPNYQTFTIDFENGDTESLSKYDPIFFDNYLYVVYLEDSDNKPSKNDCMGGCTNYGSIVIRNIETDDIYILDEEGLEYRLIPEKSSDKILVYQTYEINNKEKIESWEMNVETKEKRKI